MSLRLSSALERLRSSLWFIPTVCVLAAFGLSEAAFRIDRAIAADDATYWFLFVGGTESARSVLSTIATSMLTFTGLVFSVTMLVLQLAASQLSPRVMRTFLRDRGPQVVLGVFVATFVYAVLVLRRVRDPAEGDPFVPALATWIALVLVLVSIGLFIYYIHHMAQAVRPESVMRRVASETHAAIDRLYPEGVGKAAEPAMGVPVDAPIAAIVLAPRSGVVIATNEREIAEVARDCGCAIELKAWVGDFVREGTPLFAIRGRWDGSGDAALQSAVHFNAGRTMQRDAAFGMRQLVDVAIRALSPGINDPSTAVQALDHIHELLGRISARAIPAARRELDAGVVVTLPRPAWGDYVHLACDEIRRSGGTQIQIQRRLRGMLVDLRDAVPPERRAPLDEQLALLDGELAGAFAPAENARATTPSAQGNGPS